MSSLNNNNNNNNKNNFEFLPCWPVNVPQRTGGRCVSNALVAPGVIVSPSVAGHAAAGLAG